MNENTSLSLLATIVCGFFCSPGAWVTKVSNREKRQQRRTDKGPEDSGSPGGVEAPKSNVEAAANTNKKRGNHGIHQCDEH